MGKATKAKGPSPEELADQEQRHAAHMAEARAYWKVGMVTSLPLWCEIEGGQSIEGEDGEPVSTQAGAYTQMLPGVVESIADDKAAVRIYAAPEYGYRLEGYHLHKRVAINVPLLELGQYHGHDDLEAIAAAGLLEHGSAEVAARVRALEREMDARSKAIGKRRKVEPSTTPDLFGDQP